MDDFIIPPFLNKEVQEEKPVTKEIENDPVAGDYLNALSPNFKKKTANLHYMSEVTGEVGTLLIRPGISEDDIMNQYAKKFPKECRFFLMEIKNITQVLFSGTGMSRERTMMSLTKIPQILYLAMKFIDEDYWSDKKRYYRFLRKYPKFMVGNHNHKTTRGIVR